MHVPGNDHGDGLAGRASAGRAIDLEATLALAVGGQTAPPARPAPAPDETTRQIQAHLITLGYDLGETGADGHFGPLTEAASVAYRSDYSTGTLATTTALLASLEDTVTTLADLAKTVADLPRTLWRADVPVDALTRQAYGIDASTAPAWKLLGWAARRANGAWKNADSAVRIGRANADRLKGLEQAIQELAANTPGVDAGAVAAAIEAAVGRYELTLSKIDTDTEEN